MALIFVLIMFGNITHGATPFYPMVVIFIILVWQLCVGPSGIVATRRPLSSDSKTPVEVVFSSCVFLDYWAGLLKSEDQEAMRNDAQG